MTKSLSQQLCELVGIKPKRLYIGRIGNHWLTKEEFDKKIDNILYKETGQVCYPDFTEPSNLIKLMDLKYTPCQSLMLLITLHNVGIRSTIDFLEQLIDFLRADGVFIGNIKQAIRDTEWKY